MKPATHNSSLSDETGAVLDPAIERTARELLHGVPDRLAESILYSLLGPGKRIRPRIVYAMSRAFGLKDEIALTLAAALEMTHAYTLIHDDLPAMDNDDLRRGRPTNHKVYGEGMAVLAGDSLALLGPDALLRLRGEVLPDRLLVLVAGLLDVAGARGVIAGQAAEMGLTGQSKRYESARLIEIFRLKTGALFRAALSLPAIASGAPPDLVSELERLGDSLGIAFQIADDLEDDFVAKRADPAHIAFYFDAPAAREMAERKLEVSAGLPATVREALQIFIAELRRKIAAGAA